MASTTRGALLWSFAERYASFLVTLASTLLLARLLTPAQIGVYSLCAALGTAATILRDFGISEYLIQERELTRDKLRTAFGLALTAAWILGALIYLGRGMAAEFFAEPQVSAVLAITALHFAILPLSSPAFALLNREMAFRKIFLLQLTSNTAQSVGMVLLAWRGFGTLSLAWGPVIHVLTQTAVLAFMQPAESRVLPSWKEARVVSRFGLRYMLARTIENIAQGVHEPVIARLWGFASLGLFSRAMGLVELFRNHVTDAAVRVATPAFAAEYRAGRSSAESLARATAIFSSVAWPFFGFVALLAHEIIDLLFGAQWLPAAPIATILALCALPAGLYEFVPQMLSATGHVRRRLSMTLVVAPLHVAAVCGAARWGLEALAAAWGVGALAMLGLAGWHLRAVFGISPRALLRPCLASALVAAASVALQGTAAMACRAADLPPLLTLLAAGAAGLAGWGLAVSATRHPSRDELRRIGHTAWGKFCETWGKGRPDGPRKDPP